MCTTSALAVDTVFVPLQRRADGHYFIIQNNRYDRQQYISIAAAAELHNQYDANGNYLVEPGETWRWEWRRVATDELLNAESVTFLGGDNLCWDFGACGNFDVLAARWDERCMREDVYTMALYHNGDLVDQLEFRPSRFVPIVQEAVHAETIQPRRYRNENAEFTDIAVVVADNLSCGQLLPDVRVRLTSTIKPGSNAHTHFNGGAERGSGRFESLGFDAVLDPDGSASQGTVIDGLTDDNGLFKARYHAEDLAAVDVLRIETERPAENGEPRIIGQPVESEIQVGFQDLVEITAANAAVIFADGGTCPGHDPLPHWLTATARAKVQAVAAAYQGTTGNMLSLNDASLPMGGLIDNRKSGGRDAACHASHRQGIDIDINSIDSGGLILRCSSGPENCSPTSIETLPGQSAKLLDILTRMFVYADAKKIPEEPIHYRF